jgi:1,2-diacylglycerol 3-beta-galactosyltransferase
VSVHPLCQYMPTRIIKGMNAELLVSESGRLPIAFATVVSDLIDAHQTWFNADADAIFVPTREVHNVCIQGMAGVDPSKVKIHGLPVRPCFWNPISVSFVYIT